MLDSVNAFPSQTAHLAIKRIHVYKLPFSFLSRRGLLKRDARIKIELNINSPTTSGSKRTIQFVYPHLGYSAARLFDKEKKQKKKKHSLLDNDGVLCSRCTRRFCLIFGNCFNLPECLTTVCSRNNVWKREAVQFNWHSTSGCFCHVWLPHVLVMDSTIMCPPFFLCMPNPAPP